MTLEPRTDFLEAKDILGPIRCYYHKGGTQGKDLPALGWCLDGRPALKEEIIREAEDWIERHGYVK